MSPIILIRLWMISGFVLLLLMNPLYGGASFMAETAGQQVIQWHEWGPEAFQRAQDEDKLMVLDLTAVWCHACHVMDQTTFTDPRIIHLLNTHFIPIRVDTDQRPDLEARYRAGGWPTINLLLPTGEILFQSNALTSEEMEAILKEVQSIYVTDKADLVKEASTLWNQMEEKVGASPFQGHVLETAMVEQSVQVIKQQYDPMNKGFLEAPKFFEPEAVQMALAYGFLKNDPELIQIGVETLKKQLALLDPVWGGFYRYAEQSDWSRPHFEKMLTIQAWNLRNYVEAFQLTEDVLFKRISETQIEYVLRFLRDSRTGLFYESQDADVRDEKEEFTVSGADYYSLSESKRLAIGLPRVDKRTFTGSNALVIQAFLTASPVVDKPELQDIALQTLNHIIENRFDIKKGLAHLEREGELSLFGVLSDHVLVGQALLEAYSATGQFQFLKKSEALAQVSLQLLYDSVNGGFFDRPRLPDTLGLLKLPAKPARENFQAARWYLTLFHFTGTMEYRAVAESTLQSMMTSLQPLPIGLAGLALDQWFRVPVHIAVVGHSNDSGTTSLLLESRRLYYPGKIVKRIDPKNEEPKWGEIIFPFDGRPVAFVCTDRLCSPPAFQAEKLRPNLAEIFTLLQNPPLQ